MRSVKPMKAAKIGYIVMSAAFCLFGIVLIVLPELSISVIGRLLGILLAVFGVVKIVGYFSRDLYRLAFQYDLAFGILLIALGAVVLLRPEQVIHFICVVLGISVLADGLFKIQIAMDSKRFGVKSWWLIFSLAVLAGVVGALLVFRPSESARVLTVLLGITMLAEGLLSLCVAVSIVKIVRHQRPDVIEVIEEGKD